MNAVIVDTNVIIAANSEAEHASLKDVECCQKLAFSHFVEGKLPTAGTGFKKSLPLAGHLHSHSRNKLCPHIPSILPGDRSHNIASLAHH